MTNAINLHHPPNVDAFSLVPDPDTPLSLSLSFPGELRTGVFALDNSVLFGRTFQLGAGDIRGEVHLTVHRDEKAVPPRGFASSGGTDIVNEPWEKFGIQRVSGTFSVAYARLQSWMTLEERPGTVTGQFVWAPGCANAMGLQAGGSRGAEPRASNYDRERAAGLVHEQVRRNILDNMGR